MASRLSTPLGFTGIFLLIVGILMTVGGIIGLIVQSNQPKSWWVWFLIFVGIVLGILGAVLLAIALSRTEVDPCRQIEMRAYAPAPVVYQQPTPIMVAPPPYVAPLAPQYIPAPQPIYQQVAAPLPAANLGTSIYTTEHPKFDPDPVDVFTQSPGTRQRAFVKGPYGPNGEEIEVSGTLTSAPIATKRTYDIPDHQVVVNQRPPQYVAGSQARYIAAPQGRYIAAPQGRYVSAPKPVLAANLDTSTYVAGRPSFDPDPVDVFTQSPGTSQRAFVKGPYGPNGEEIGVSGTLTSAPTATKRTYDIPDHQVVVNGLFPNYGTSPSSYQALRTYQPVQ